MGVVKFVKPDSALLKMGLSHMNQPPADSTQGGSRPSRLPHVGAVLAGIALLASVILLWTGQFSSPSPSEQAAFGSAGDSLETEGANPELLEDPDATTGTDGKQPDETDTDKKTAGNAADAGEGTGTASARDPQVDQFKKAILGSWKQYSFGHRLLHVKEDGTATIDVKLDGLFAIYIGEKFRLDIEWSITGDELVFKTTGGTPKSSVDAVTSFYGDKRVYRILEINEKQILLKDEDEEKTPWDRVTDADPPVNEKPSD